MDKNSLIGIVLILGILIGWSVWMTPSKEELAQQRHIQDSINRVKQERFVKDSIAMAEANAVMTETNNTVEDESYAARYNQFGSFANASVGENKTWTLENDLLKVDLSSRGAYVKTVELKDYKTFDSLPLIGFDEETSRFNLEFLADGKGINSYDLYFEPYINGFPYEGNETITLDGKDSLVMSLRAYVADSEGNKIVYYCCQTTYIEDEYGETTGLNTDAIGMVIDFAQIQNRRDCKVNAYDAFRCEIGERSYLCWTISPEISCVIEYSADINAEADILRMAQSVQPPA